MSLRMIAMLVTAAVALAQTPYVPSRTAEGLPDIEGIWQPQTSGAAFSILSHPGGFFLGGGGKGIVEGDSIPYQPWAAAKVKERLQHMEIDPTGHCHFEGVPHSLFVGGIQIFETPKYIALVHEIMHAWRIIYMDGKPHPKDYEAWMGDSRGHWEGNTLVVDVADNNDKSVFDMAGHFHSNALHVVERYTPVDHDTIQYEATIEDPKVLTKPFKIKFPIKRARKDYMIMESGCFEDERDQLHLVDGLATIPKDHYDDKQEKK
jgi:hypothetical protein